VDRLKNLVLSLSCFDKFLEKTHRISVIPSSRVELDRIYCNDCGGLKNPILNHTKESIIVIVNTNKLDN